MSLLSPLPPPFRDPSGKIYIAIPAPPFVLAQDATDTSQTVNRAPGYIYIEYNSNGPHDLPQDLILSAQTKPVETTPSLSVQRWMTSNCSAEPPPDHVPWAGHVSASFSSGASSISINELPDARRRVVNIESSILRTLSSSTLDIRTADSGNSLLNGSLPSTCSSAWSGGMEAPPISEAKAVARAPRVKSIPAPRIYKSDSNTKYRCDPDKRRYTVCATSLSKRREAQIFNRRRTMEKTERVQPPLSGTERRLSDARIMSQIDELGGFFSEGLKAVDLTVRRLNQEQDKIGTPSLVVSTSFAINPVSLESFDDLRTSNPSLANRRGKVVPGILKLDNCPGSVSSTIDYPDVPTAFRVSPEPTPNALLVPSKYPGTRFDSKMTTDQMISSLREQVESFYPRCRDSGRISSAFDMQCEDAESWLKEELGYSASENKSSPGVKPPNATLKPKYLNSSEALSDDETTSPISYMFPLPPTKRERDDHMKPRQNSPSIGLRARALSLHASLSRLSVGSLRVRTSETPTPKTKPRKSILSTGSTSSSGSAKKVRFSDTPPSIIPPLESIPKLSGPSTVPSPTKLSPVSPPKRKPVPDFDPPDVRSSTLSMPIKSPAARRPSLSPATQARIITPASRVVNEGLLSGSSIPVVATPPMKGPLIFNSGSSFNTKDCRGKEKNPPKKPSRPMSLGANLRENRDRSISDKLASIAKRRSYSSGVSSADKENQRSSKIVELVVKEAQKKGRKSGLPFLSRWRG